MPSTPSTSLRLELMATGENSGTWGAKTNTNLGTLLEQAICGWASINVAGSTDVTLTATNYASDQSRNARIQLTGAVTANISIIVPTAVKAWMFDNQTTGGKTQTVKTSGGTGVVLPASGKCMVYCDGTNVVYDAVQTGPIGNVMQQHLSNPTFEVGQEYGGAANSAGTSVSCAAGTPTFPVDEWAVVAAGAAVAAQQVVNTVSGSRARKALTITGATSVTTVNLRQRLESVNMPALKRQTCHGITITNNTGGSLTASLLLDTPAAVDDFSSVSNKLTQALTAIGNGSTATVYFPIDISGYANIDNGLQWQIQFPSGALNSGAKSVTITEAFAVEGPTPGPFLRRSYDDELLRCMRYFQIIGNGTSEYLAEGAVTATLTVSIVSASMVVPMLKAPTLAGAAGAAPTDFTASNYQFTNTLSAITQEFTTVKRWGARLTHALTGLGASQSIVLITLNNNARLSLDGRL